MFRNAEGYYDPTAGEVYKRLAAEERKKERERAERIDGLIPALRTMAALMGFDIVGRITLRDRETGKEYR